VGATSQRNRQRPGDDPEVPSLGTLEPAAPSPAPVPEDPARARQALGRAVSAARSLGEGEGREEATAGLNAHFTALQGLAPAEAAGILRDLLESRVLDGLQGPDGWTARAQATSLLISLPWPHALEVTPEDLHHLREQERMPRHARDRRQPRYLVAAAPVLIAAAGVALDATVGAGAGLLLGTTALAAAVGAGGLIPVRWLTRASAIFLLTGGLAAAVVSMVSGTLDGLFLGAGAFLAGLVGWAKADRP
jgi:hypothetical protein